MINIEIEKENIICVKDKDGKESYFRLIGKLDNPKLDGKNKYKRLLIERIKIEEETK